MAVATAVQPNYNTDTGTAYPLNIDAALAVVKIIGDNFSPHEQSTPNMTLRVEAGSIITNGVLASVAAQSSGTITAPSVNPRYDIAAINPRSGAVVIYTGTEAASPSDPTVSPGFIPIARIALQTSTTAITNSIITDLRALWQQLVSGIDPDETPQNYVLGNMAYADNVTAGDLRGTASRLTGTDSSGNGAEVTVSTGLSLSANVLTNTATAGRWITINTFTPAAAATCDVTGFDAATYIDYMVILDRVSPSTDNQVLRLLTSTDGGSNYDGGASDYGHVSGGASIGTGALTSGANTAAFIDLTATAGVGNATNEFVSGIIRMINPGAAAYFQCDWHLGFITGAGNRTFITGSGWRLTAADVNAVRLLFASGNISGTVRLLGRLP